jgi:thioredoxin-related protein
MRKVLFLFSVACSFLCAEVPPMENTLLVPALPSHQMQRTMLQQRRSPLWNENYDQATRTAQKTGKPLILAFMGAGWCPWSEKFEKEILSEAGFLDTLKDKVALVWVTCSQDGSRSTPEVRALKEKYAVEQYPTLVVVSAYQEEMFRVGYLPLSAKEFASRLDQMIQDYQELWGKIENPEAAPIAAEDLESLYQKACSLSSNKYKEKLMSLGLQKDRGTFFLLEKYGKLLENGKKNEAEPIKNKIIERDPKNLKGSLLRLAILEFQTRVTRLKRKDSPITAVKPLLEYLRKFGEKDKENRWKLEMMMAQYLFTKNEIAEALHHAKASYDSAPDASKSEVAQTIDLLKSYQ